MPAKTITLSIPVTLTLTPDEVQTIVIALKELPYKFSQPVLDHILEACQPITTEPVDGANNGGQ